MALPSREDLLVNALRLIHALEERRALSVAEVADLLGGCERTAYRWIDGLNALPGYEQTYGIGRAGIRVVAGLSERVYCDRCTRLVWIADGRCPRCAQALGRETAAA